MKFHLSRLDLLLGAVLLLTTSFLMGVGVTASRAGHEKSDRHQLQSASLNRERIEQQVRRDPTLFRKIRVASMGVLLLLVGSAWGLIQLLARLLRRVPISNPLGTPPPPGWALPEIIRLVLWVVLISQWAWLMEWALFQFYRPGWLDLHVITLGNTLLIDTTVMIGVWILWTRRRRPGSDARLRLADAAPLTPPGARLRLADAAPLTPAGAPTLWASLKFGVASYVTFLPFLVFLLLIMGVVAKMLPEEPGPQPIFTMYLTESRGPVVGWMLFLVMVVAPVAEELFFRGILYGWLRARMGVWKGLGLSALLFAVLHANFMVFLPILGLGLLFGWVYEQTGSLAAPVVVHILHNGGMFYLASLIKEMIFLK